MELKANGPNEQDSAKGSYTHVWLSHEADLPCALTGREGPDSDGQVFVEITRGDSVTFVPKDELVTFVAWKEEQARTATIDSVTLAALVHRPVWVGWKEEIRDGKKTKVPYDPRTGDRAKSDNPATWATHDEADNWAAMNGGVGVGLMLGGNFNTGGVVLTPAGTRQRASLRPGRRR
jgi:hypothetical protein